MRILRWLALSAMLSASLNAPAAAPEAKLPPGGASGSVKVNGKSAPLAHAYLTEEEYDSGRKLGIVITLSEETLDAAQLADEMAELTSLARKGRLHAVRVKVGEDRKVYSAEIYHDAFANWPTTSITGVNEFEAPLFTPAAVQGRAYMKAPWKGSSSEIFYDATFNASRAQKTK